MWWQTLHDHRGAIEPGVVNRYQLISEINRYYQPIVIDRYRKSIESKSQKHIVCQLLSIENIDNNR